MIAQPVAQCRPLIDVLAEIPDCRHARGKRHPLPAILALVCVAILCGYRSYSAISQWARVYPRELVVALGLTHSTSPCAATLCTILRQLDRDQLEERLATWAQSVLAALPPDPTEDEAIALDGKTLRGSKHQGAPNVHLLSALSHRLGLTLGQQAVDDKTNEISHVIPLLRMLVLEGWIFTMDALLTQRSVAQTIVEGGGDYVMLAKGNQPNLEADIALVFTEPPQDDSQLHAQTIDRAHGRIEHRCLTVSVALVGYSDWPGLQQVFRLDRETLLRSTGETRRETVYGLTSLDPARADAQRLLRIIRHHWCIENRLHWVRDVTFDEDRSQVRCGSTPEVMATFRNTAIGLLRMAGEVNIAASARRLAASPRSALALIGLSLKTE
jgi:predicted transposase YbfD/YdcC